MFAFIAQGCSPIPFPAKIYKPSSKDGLLRESSCGYNQGPGIWDELEVRIEPLKLFFRITEMNEDLLHFRANIQSSSFESFSFISNEFTLSTMKRDYPYRVKKIQSQSFSQGKFTVQSYEFDSIIVNNGKYRSYSFSFDFPKPSEETFSVKPPNLLINGIEKDISVINFKKDISWYFLTINC